MIKTPRSLSTLLHNTPHLDPDLMELGALKKMTGTTSFKQLPDYQKNCLVHNREECQTGKYLEQVRKECQCAPWALVSNQVECKIKIAKGTTDPRVEFCWPCLLPAASKSKLPTKMSTYPCISEETSESWKCLYFRAFLQMNCEADINIGSITSYWKSLVHKE